MGKRKVQQENNEGGGRSSSALDKKAWQSKSSLVGPGCFFCLINTPEQAIPSSKRF